MLDYAICEIGGKQYKFLPNQPLLVDLQDNSKPIEVGVLMMVENNKVKLGKPYLKEKLNLKVLEEVKGEKIRVAKFHAKANYRRVTGIRPKYTKVVLVS